VSHLCHSAAAPFSRVRSVRRSEIIVTVNTAPGHFDRKQYQAVRAVGLASS